jgi:hypothetical protein
MKRLNIQTENSRMKSFLSGYYKLIYLLVIAGMIGLIASCDSTSDTDRVPEIEGVRYVHPDSAAAKQMDQVGPGEMFVIIGKNLTSTTRVFFNGIEASFNPTLVTSTHMVIRVPGDIPFGRLDPDAPEMNTIRLVSNAGEVIFNFPILPPAPEIERVNKEFASAGETVRITGRYLYLVEEVTFPGGIQASDFRFAENGSWLTVTVPDGVTEAGHINITTSSGTTEQNYRNMFNDRTGIFIDYDEKNPYTPWGTPGAGAPYVGTDVPGIPPLDGNYIHWIYTDPLTPGMWWFQDLATPHANWAGLSFPDYPENTPSSELVFRMEIFTPHDKFKSGYIQLSFDWWIEKDWNPFIVNGERVPLVTDGWETVTIPMDSFQRGSPATYGPFKNSGEFLLRYVNPGEPDGAAFDEVNIAFDNLRIVRKF